MKTLLSLVVFIFLSSLVTAQTEVSIGLKAGVNLSRWKRSESIQAEERRTPGLVAAMPIEIRFNKIVALQPEPTIIQKGTKIKSWDDFDEARAIITYAELPLLLKLILEPRVQFHLVAGGFAGYALAGKEVYRNRNGRKQDTSIEFYRSGISRFDMGLTAGFGIKIPVKHLFLSLDGRYSYSLSNLVDISTIDLKVQNTGIIFTTGLVIPVGKKAAEKK